MNNTIKEINEKAPNITESDIDKWVLPKLLEHYSYKISSLSVRAYGNSANSVAKEAFFEKAKHELHNAVNTFLFKSQHWKTGRDIGSYLQTCLNRLADRIKWDVDNVKKINVLICPACRHFGRKEFLINEPPNWRCSYCSDELDRLPIEIENLKNKEDKTDVEKNSIISFEARMRMHRIFSLHSRKGYRCLDCERFIPESANGQYGISCPYEDCMFSGKIEFLEKMAHPVSLSQRNIVSLQTPIKNGQNNKTDFQANLIAENVNADVRLELHQNFHYELEVLSNVILDQIQAIKRTNSAGTMMQKLLMYEAFQEMLENFPEEMVSYLVHRKQNSDFPIQSRIFQTYARLMEEALPIDLVINGKKYSILSLTDPFLQLFTGISEFEAVVQDNYVIPNNTVERYVGGDEFKDYGPCFIGMIIDVIDKKTGKSIKDNVVNHSFAQINVNMDVEPGTNVIVKHFRLDSHYELGGLVFLQRARKRIVNSVYYRLNKQKRVVG